MIKKYTALCLIISSLTLCSAEKEPTETTFVISSKKTAWFQSLDTRFNIVMNKQQQEHAAQQQKMNQEHEDRQAKIKQANEKNITKYEKIFMSKYDENEIRFKNQLNEMKKEVREANRELKEKEIKLYRSIFYGALTISELTALIAGYKTESWSIGISLTSLNLLVGSGALLLEKILTPPSQPATENKEDEAIKDNTEEIHDESK